MYVCMYAYIYIYLFIYLVIYICIFIIIDTGVTRRFLCGVSSICILCQGSLVNVGKPWPSHVFSSSSRELLKLWMQLAICKLASYEFVFEQGFVPPSKKVFSLLLWCDSISNDFVFVCGWAGWMGLKCIKFVEHSSTFWPRYSFTEDIPPQILNQRAANCLLSSVWFPNAGWLSTTFGHVLNTLSWKLMLYIQK